VNVTVLLRRCLLERARIGLAHRHTVTAVRTLSDLELTWQCETPDVVMLDPLAAETESVARLLVAYDRLRGVPLVMYTMLSAEAMRAVAALAHAGAPHLILAGYDDGPGALATVLESLPPTTFSGRFLERLGTPLQAMPVELRMAVRELFQAPPKIRSTLALAAAGNMTLRTLDRWIGRVGLASPGSVITCARLVRACWLLRTGARPLTHVSQSAGFSSVRSLRHRLVSTLGTSVSSIRNAANAEQILDRLELSVRCG
jgi:AraC-like DNA-binding protein